MTQTLYMRRALTAQRTWIALAAIGLGGFLTFQFGVPGTFVLGPSLLGLVVVWMRGRRPLIVIDEQTIRLQIGNTQSIKLTQIVQAQRTKDDVIEMRLKSGETVSFSISALEEEDQVQLGRAIKRATKG